MTITPIISEIRLSENDAFVLARKLAHMDTAGYPVSPGVLLLTQAFKSEDPYHLKALTNLLEETKLLQQVFAQDPNTPPQPRPQNGGDIYIPPLPKEAQLSDAALQAAEKVGGWYRQTVKWATQRSPMTPVHFLESGVVWLIGLAVARRVCIDFHERIFPHLYLLLVAETSKYAKSTGMNALLSLVIATMPHLLIPGQTSPEGMIEILSGDLPSNYEKLSVMDKALIENGRKFAAQRGIILDEYSGLLGASKKDYMQGFIELLMRLYDARELETYYTRTGGISIIRNPSLCILGATTPAAMARACTYESWENGANARYLIMFREKPLQYNPDYIPATPPKEIVSPLATLHTNLPQMRGDLNEEKPFTPIFAQMTEDARKQYMAYTQAVFYDLITDDLDEQIHGNYRRMHIQALKCALALATMDWVTEDKQLGKPVINTGHFALGQELAEKSRASLHRLIPVLNQSVDSRTQRDLMAVLRRTPSGLTMRELSRFIGRNTKDLRTAIDVLSESGEIEILEHRPPTGRPTSLYRVVSAI